MPRKPAVSDEKIIEAIKENPDATSCAICRAAGAQPSGSNYERIKKLRPIALAKPQEGQEIVKFKDLRKDDRITRAGKRLIVVAVAKELATLRRMDGSMFQLDPAQFDAAEYARVPSGAPRGGPVTTYFVEPEKSEPIKAGDVKINGQPAKSLPDNVVDRIIEKIKENAVPSKPVSPTTEEVLEDMEKKMEKPLQQPEKIGYIGTGRVSGKPVRRDYLDRINQLLNVTMPDCRAGILDETVTLATKMLAKGIREEAGENNGKV